MKKQKSKPISPAKKQRIHKMFNEKLDLDHARYLELLDVGRLQDVFRKLSKRPDFKHADV